jgi:hypothetical protein
MWAKRKWWWKLKWRWITVCDIPPDTLARIWPEQATCSVRIFTAYIHLLSTNSSYRPLHLYIWPSLVARSLYVVLPGPLFPSCWLMSHSASRLSLFQNTGNSMTPDVRLLSYHRERRTMTHRSVAGVRLATSRFRLLPVMSSFRFGLHNQTGLKPAKLG